MKTFVPFTKFTCSVIALFVSLITGVAFAQSTVKAVTYSFSGPTLQSGSDLNVGAVYLFKNVTTGVDAKLRVDATVNGARLVDIDNNDGIYGYKEQIQPVVETGNATGESYVQFTISFYAANTNTLKAIQKANITPIDIDGYDALKEFVELSMGNSGMASYMRNSPDISLRRSGPANSGIFRADNVLGVDRVGVDTTARANMFTGSANNISSFSVKFGSVKTATGIIRREIGLYMKDFNYVNEVVLPVELASFTAMLISDSKVDLKWTTAVEKNLSHIVIEKSLDGKEFADAGVVFANGNTSDEMNYSYSDKLNASQTVVYYRLRFEDIDGHKQFSPIRAIRIAKQNEQKVTILTYPNPVTTELRVTVPRDWQGKKVSYEVLNNNGRLSIRTESGNSSQTEAINVSSLNSGVYLVRVTCNGETAVQKIVKQ
jgi:Secretion system C-terminal sorting domain